MKNNKVYITFVSIIIIVSIISGIIYGINNPFDVSNYLDSLNSNNNLFIPHIIIISLFYISTISLLGIIAQLLFLGFYSISLGYILSSFVKVYKFKGFLYALSIILINNFMFLIIVSYLLIVSIKYIKRIIYNLKGIDNNTYKKILIPLSKKYLIILVCLLILDTFIFMFGNKILNFLQFML